MCKHPLLKLAATGIVLGSTGIGLANSVEAVNAPVVVDYRGVTTEDFESGSLKLSDVSEGVLVRFLQDLNRRKDFDYLAHGGQPGPDSQYLWQWVQNVTGELTNRGYWLDGDQNLHRPDGMPV